MAYLTNAIIKGKRSGLDIANYDLVLRDYESKAMTNANLMLASVDFVKNSYSDKVLGSEKLGDILGLFRNAAIDVLDTSEFAKYNFMNYASGSLTHPASYEWMLK